MHRIVWVDSWQMQCCGGPFRVGQDVQFSTTQVVDRDFLGAVLGEERAALVTDYEDHHDLDDGPMAPLVGTVEQIEVVSCEYALQGEAMYPVAGTTHVVSRDEATGWESEGEVGGLTFVGYVVTVRADEIRT